MGATVSIYWPGITKDDLSHDCGFQNDDRAWANWIVQLESTPTLKAQLETLGLGALGSYITDGMPENQVRWVTPRQFADAARTLIDLVETSDSRVTSLVDAYAKHANRLDPIPDEFCRDLEDIVTRTEVPLQRGVPRMTLSVNW